MKYATVKESRIGGRKVNQDRFGEWSTAGALLVAVADGLGGHAHGEVAAQIAVDFLGRAFANEAKPKLADPDGFLSRTMAAAHVAIMREAEARRMREVPRTVLVACLVQDGIAHWAHIGDSRLYLVRKGRVHARTRDHSLVQQLVDEGRIREEAAASHPDRNRLLQCLGGVQAPRVDAASERLEKDDVLVLCSDGLWGPLTQRQMVNALVTQSLPEAIESLLELSEARAGHDADNTTVVAVSWGEEKVALPDDGPATVPYEQLRTDVQDFTATDLDFLRMSDEDVEKAIAEIKAALKRNATQR